MEGDDGNSERYLRRQSELITEPMDKDAAGTLHASDSVTTTVIRGGIKLEENENA